MITWEEFLKAEFSKPYFISLALKLKEAYQEKTIYPKREDVFRAFALCPYQDLKVVILGQDPYHQAHQAHGLAFSVPKGRPLPPSLKNILLELSEDMVCQKPSSGDLSAWAKQGVLLLNTYLTVEEGKPLSHKDWGWDVFSQSVLKHCNDHPNPLIFILWGRQAQAQAASIDSSKHLILRAPHPSPLSSYHGFFGSKPFSQANAYLSQKGLKTIQWCL